MSDVRQPLFVSYPPYPTASRLLTRPSLGRVGRLLLIQEKEQYLRELQRVAASQRSADEADSIQSRIYRLQIDIQEAMEMSNTIIADR